MAIEIELLGELAKFRDRVPQYLSVRDAATAIKLIGVQIPEFTAELIVSENLGYAYELIIDDGEYIVDVTIRRRISRKLTIVPTPRGSGDALRIIGGIALVGLSLAVPVGILGVSAATIGTFGLALAVGGIAGLLSPQSSQQSINNSPSTNLDVTGSRTVQGTPVPYIPSLTEVRIPNNFDPVARTFGGTWNGGFTVGVTDDPAWHLYDILTNVRYGLGDLLRSIQIDVVEIYQMSRCNSERIANGLGGTEPRYSFNAVLQTAKPAIEFLSDILSSMNASHCYRGNVLTFVQDRPNPLVRDNFTDANVIHKFNELWQLTEPPFNYSDAALSAQHTVVYVKWRDPNQYGKEEIARVDLADLGFDTQYARLGNREITLTPVGCTSESLAIRYGRWLLATEQLEQETLTFSVGLQGALRTAGEIISVVDNFESASNVGGRIVACEGNRVTLDRPIQIANATTNLLIQSAEFGSSYRVLNSPGEYTTLTLNPAPSSAPDLDSIWTLPDGNATLWRIVTKENLENGTYALSCLQYSQNKYALIDDILLGQRLQTTNFDPPLPPSQLVVETNPRGYSLSWQASPSPSTVSYIVQHQDAGTNIWLDVSMVEGYTSTEVPLKSSLGQVFRVAARNIWGKQSPWANISPTFGNSGTIHTRSYNGTIVIDRIVALAPNVNYYIYTYTIRGSGALPPNSPNGYNDRRLIITNVGQANTIYVNTIECDPSFMGKIVSLPPGTYNDLGVFGLDSIVSSVQIKGSITLYEGLNASGLSQNFTTGVYAFNKNEFGSLGNDRARSAVVAAGSIAVLSEHEYGIDPTSNNWTILPY